jgi:hypothetical protein
MYKGVDQINKNETGRALALMGENRNAHTILIWKPEGERLFGCSRRRWEGSKIVRNEETVCYFVKSAILAQGREEWRALLNIVVNLLVSHNARHSLASSLSPSQ